MVNLLKINNIFFAVTGLLGLSLSTQLMAQHPADRTWSRQSAGTEYRTPQRGETQRYNPWSQLDAEKQHKGIEEQPRYIERPRREYQPEPRPAFPPAQLYGQPYGGIPYGVQPQPGGYSAYPRELLSPYGGLQGYPGYSHAPLGGSWPGVGFNPWGFMPW